MKRTLALVSGIAAVTLAGCASQVDRKTASGSYEYLKDQEGVAFVVPESVDTPNFEPDYEIPQLGEGADKSLLGRSLFVESPHLVLPLVTGSHVAEGTQSATVWFDQVDDSQPLDRAVWNSLLSFLDQNGIGVVSFEPETNVLITDWMIITEELDSSWYSWTSTESKIGRRFEFNLDVKPHGRTAALNVKLKDYTAEINDKEVVEPLNAMEARREEVDILNQVIGHYEYQIRLEDSRRIAKIRQGLQTEMGFDPDGSPAFMVSAKYDIAWPRLLLVLRKLGFNVKDLDKSNGLLFVTYSGDNVSWWEKLWSNDKLLLDEGDYRLKVEDLGENTTITFMNNESEPFEANMIADLFGPFAEVMSEDDLDI